MRPANRPPYPVRWLPPPARLRRELARELRDVDLLRGLIRLSEAVARRDGSPVSREQGVTRG
jgi:hypothetical protein